MLSQSADTFEIVPAARRENDPPRDLVDSAIAPLLARIEWLLSDFSSRPGDLRRHLSAGLLARSLGLLRSLHVLSVAQVQDGAGILFRSVVESVLLGLYVVLGPDDAVDKVAGDHARNLKIMADKLGPGEFADAVAEGWAEVETHRLSVEQVAKDLGPLLERAGDDNADATGIYNTAYRGDSTYAVHGIGPAMRYMTLSETELWRIEVDPAGNGLSSAVYLLLGSLWTGYFAAMAARPWGYTSGPFFELMVDVKTLGDEFGARLNESGGDESN